MGKKKQSAKAAAKKAARQQARARARTGPVKRRGFLAVIAVAVVAAAVALWRLGGQRRRPEQPAAKSSTDRLAALVTENFDYLTIEDGSALAFARAFEKQYGPYRDDLPADAVYGKFLLSTNFPQNGFDQAKPVRFLALYDPYASPCWNPLADLS